ncbi:LysR family transcriptional regulator [Tistrella bauzanensis]
MVNGSPDMLPSTKALRAVEAAARRRSFTGAAHELGLTHGAVAQQIRGWRPASAASCSCVTVTR